MTPASASLLEVRSRGVRPMRPNLTDSRVESHHESPPLAYRSAHAPGVPTPVPTPAAAQSGPRGHGKRPDWPPPGGRKLQPARRPTDVSGQDQVANRHLKPSTDPSVSPLA